jgi:hypothetical protein
MMNRTVDGTVNPGILRSFAWGLLTIFALALVACPTGAEDPVPEQEKETTRDLNENPVVTQSEDGTRSLTFAVPDGSTRFFKLSTGEEVTDPAIIASADWDIAFEGTRLIYTNSGESANVYKSRGFGGVWHTDSKDFSAVTSVDDGITTDPVYTPYNQDTLRYEGNMSGIYLRRLNVITYKGYGVETDTANNGSSRDTAFGLGYAYDKHQFYYNPPMPDGSLRMPPDFKPTGWVYIIRHGNGAEYSKLQISEFRRDFSGVDHFTITWQLLEED